MQQQLEGQTFECTIYGLCQLKLKNIVIYWVNHNRNSSLIILFPFSDLNIIMHAFSFTGPFKDYPQVTVYHPSDPNNGHAFANIGWTGWFGSITGTYIYYTIQ